MADESDGIEEAFDGQLRVLVTAAGQVGERIARAREDALRRGQAVSEREARELRSRIEAERAAARAELGSVYRSQWWDRSTPEQIAGTYQVARAWAAADPEALRAQQRMGDELRTRYGIDVDQADAAPAAVLAAVQRAEERAGQPEAPRQQVAGENAEAVRLMAAAAVADRMAERSREAAEHEPDPEDRAQARQEAGQAQGQADARAGAQPRDGSPEREDRAPYDSPERRESTARRLDASDLDPKTAAMLRRVDVEQGMPATEATRSGPSNAPKARARRGRSAQAQRTGLDR